MSTGLNYLDILKVLQHRYPFLLIDKILHIDLEKKFIISQKNVTANEPFFQGHFPSFPIMPGVLIIEAMGQTGAIPALVKNLEKKEFYQKEVIFVGTKRVKFRNAVVPGDVLTIKSIVIASKGPLFTIKVDVYLANGAKAAEGEMMACLYDIGYTKSMVEKRLNSETYQDNMGLLDIDKN